VKTIYNIMLVTFLLLFIFSAIGVQLFKVPSHRRFVLRWSDDLKRISFCLSRSSNCWQGICFCFAVFSTIYVTMSRVFMPPSVRGLSSAGPFVHLSVRPSVCYQTCRHDILKKNETDFAVNWQKWFARNDRLWGQEVKGQRSRSQKAENTSNVWTRCFENDFAATWHKWSTG